VRKNLENLRFSCRTSLKLFGKVLRKSCQLGIRAKMTYVAEGFNGPHLKTGDKCPPLAKDKLRLYAMRYCPFAERAMITLSVKEIPHEVVNINLREKPEWLAEKNPNGAVPVVAQNGKIVYDSLLVAEYLDDSYPQHPILPKDPYERAQQKLLVDKLSKLGNAVTAVYRGLREDPKTVEAITDAVKLFENTLHDDYFGGKSPSWADYMVWPMVERIHGFNDLVGNKVPIGNFPKFVAYMERMKSRPEIKRILKSDKAHIAFLRGTVIDNKPPYDQQID